MTWINQTKADIKKKYKITPKVVENYQTRYKRFYHRAVFRFETDNFSSSTYSWDRRDWQSSNEVSRSLRQALDNKVKIRNEWFETFVYFNDLDQLLDAVPKQYLCNLIRLELMQPTAIDAKQKFTHDYPVELTVKSRLPFDKYRYRVYINISGKVRKSIGAGNLRAIYGALTAYEGLKFTDSFTTTADRTGYMNAVYFYAETLDWLPLIYMMEPRYIKRIEQFTTTKELENNDPTA